jgi:hypothetical protein
MALKWSEVGPLEVIEADDKTYVVDGAGDTIATMGQAMTLDTERSMARLFAAAPQLFRACQLVCACHASTKASGCHVGKEAVDAVYAVVNGLNGEMWGIGTHEQFLEADEAWLAATALNENADEPEIDDSVKCCPDCERPNQFGEVCPSCLRERSEEGGAA